MDFKNKGNLRKLVFALVGGLIGLCIAYASSLFFLPKHEPEWAPISTNTVEAELPTNWLGIQEGNVTTFLEFNNVYGILHPSVTVYTFELTDSLESFAAEDVERFKQIHDSDLTWWTQRTTFRNQPALKLKMIYEKEDCPTSDYEKTDLTSKFTDKQLCSATDTWFYIVSPQGVRLIAYSIPDWRGSDVQPQIDRIINSITFKSQGITV